VFDPHLGADPLGEEWPADLRRRRQGGMNQSRGRLEVGSDLMVCWNMIDASFCRRSPNVLRRSIDFAESVAAMHPYHVVRALGGALYLAGTLIMAWNIAMTILGRMRQEEPAAGSSPALQPAE